MTFRARELTLTDISKLVALAAESTAPAPVYKAVQEIAREACGWRLFTVLKYMEAEQAVARVHSSDEAAYPVGGRKPLDKIRDTHAAMADGQVFLAATREDVRRAYFDHELIFSLGITAILNAPIRHGGRRLGTLNLCGEEGMYDGAAVERAKILAGLVAPCLLVG